MFPRMDAGAIWTTCLSEANGREEEWKHGDQCPGAIDSVDNLLEEWGRDEGENSSDREDDSSGTSAEGG